MIILTKKTLRNYLIENKLITKKEKVKITSLSGGYVNQVFRIKTKTKQFVLKQAAAEEAHQTPELKASKERNVYEVAAMRLFKTNKHVPNVLLYDKENFIITMNAAPEDAVLYRTELLDGKFHFDVAYKLGKFMAYIHNKTYQSEDAKKSFLKNPGHELKVLGIATAFKKYPKRKKALEEAYEKHHKNAICGIDVDITPKNILIHNGTFTKVDYEVFTYGDPAYDAGVALTHFILPAFVHSQWKREYFFCTQLFWEAYQKNITFKLPKLFFKNMKNYIALQMLGRVDSVLVLPWLKGHHEIVRNAALGIFDTHFSDLNKLLDLLNKKI